MDASFEYQQNLANLMLGVVVIHAKSNRYAGIEPMKEELAAVVKSVVAGQLLPASSQTGRPNRVQSPTEPCWVWRSDRVKFWIPGLTLECSGGSTKPGAPLFFPALRRRRSKSLRRGGPWP